MATQVGTYSWPPQDANNQILIDPNPVFVSVQPNEMVWRSLEQKGDEMPKPRSGHTLTWVGQNKYLMYGGIEDNETNRIVPTPDVWQLTVSSSKYSL